MKRTKDEPIPRAARLESVKAAATGGCVDSWVYALDEPGRTGLFRRVAREGQGLKATVAGATLAVWESGLIELVPFHALEEELLLCGIGDHARPAQAPPPAPPDVAGLPAGGRPTRGAEEIDLDAGLPPPPPMVDGRSPEQLKADGDDRWPDGRAYAPPAVAEQEANLTPHGTIWGEGGEEGYRAAHPSAEGPPELTPPVEEALAKELPLADLAKKHRRPARPQRQPGDQ